MKTRFVIISHGRTGSTILCNALNINPSICCAYELFGPPSKNPESINNYTAGSGKEFLQEFYQLTSKPVIGFKIFTFHARENKNQITAWDYLISNTDIKCIFLGRQDLLASYISEERAKQSGEWRPTGDNKGLEKKILVDPFAAEHYLNKVCAEMKWAKESFSSHPSLEIYYEDMQQDFETVIHQVSSFLGVEYVHTGLKFNSLLGSDYQKDVENYNELITYLNRTIFRHA